MRALPFSGYTDGMNNQHSPFAPPAPGEEPSSSAPVADPPDPSLYDPTVSLVGNEDICTPLEDATMKAPPSLMNQLYGSAGTTQQLPVISMDTFAPGNGQSFAPADPAAADPSAPFASGGQASGVGGQAFDQAGQVPSQEGYISPALPPSFSGSANATSDPPSSCICIDAAYSSPNGACNANAAGDFYARKCSPSIRGFFCALAYSACGGSCHIAVHNGDYAGDIADC